MCLTSDRIETNITTLVCIPLNGQYVELDSQTGPISHVRWADCHNVTSYILLLFVRSVMVMVAPHS